MTTKQRGRVPKARERIGLVHQPITELPVLREWLLKLVHPGVQRLYHQLGTASNPEEYIVLKAALAAELVAIKEAELPDRSSPWRQTSVFCPACKGLVAPASVTRPLQLEALHLHLTGTHKDAPCPVLGELLHHFDTTVRTRMFSDAALREAQEHYTASTETIFGFLARKREERARGTEEA